jgi:DNA transformation protein
MKCLLKKATIVPATPIRLHRISPVADTTMAQPTEFVRYVCEHLVPLGQVSARSMFGGWGLYVDDQFFAIVHRDTLYLRADDMTRPDFEAKGCGPFKPFANKATILSYHEAPAEIFEDAAQMLVWGHKALDSALRGRNTKPHKPRKNRGTSE